MKKIKRKLEPMKIPVRGIDQMAIVDADNYEILSKLDWYWGKDRWGRDNVVVDVPMEDGTVQVMAMDETVMKLSQPGVKETIREEFL